MNIKFRCLYLNKNNPIVKYDILTDYFYCIIDKSETKDGNSEEVFPNIAISSIINSGWKFVRQTGADENDKSKQYSYSFVKINT